MQTIECMPSILHPSVHAVEKTVYSRLMPCNVGKAQQPKPAGAAQVHVYVTELQPLLVCNAIFADKIARVPSICIGDLHIKAIKPKHTSKLEHVCQSSTGEIQGQQSSKATWTMHLHVSLLSLLLHSVRAYPWKLHGCDRFIQHVNMACVSGQQTNMLATAGTCKGCVVRCSAAALTVCITCTALLPLIAMQRRN